MFKECYLGYQLSWKMFLIFFHKVLARKTERNISSDIFLLNTTLVTPGALAHRMQCHTACNAAPPAKYKMAARVPQNGRRGLEKCLPLGFWAFEATFAKQVFWSEHSFYEKRSRRRKREKKRGKKRRKKKEKTDENSGHYVIASSRPPERRPLERRTLAPKFTGIQLFMVKWTNKLELWCA